MIIKAEEYQHLLDTVRAQERRIAVLVGLLRRVDHQHQPDEIMSVVWGDRCSEFQQGCPNCDAYALRDDVRAALKEGE